ncbi:MAG TPA: CTP synthase, partial [Polyangiaceae bacterium]|nr:CTP synthase [Polyangiaceae bacterium]
LGLGIQPEILICRCDRELPDALKKKIAHFCNVSTERVIAAPDVSVIYELPMKLHEEGIDVQITKQLNIWSRDPDLSAWKDTVEKLTRPARGRVKIALVGKYVHLRDSYKSLHEALVHGGLPSDVVIDIEYVDSEDLTAANVEAKLGTMDGLLVPGGFGGRGTEGKVEAIRFAREEGLPFLGICLGMQMAVIEYARNVCDIEGAQSREFEPDAQHAVIDLMPDQKDVKNKGGTMRLGAYPCELRSGSRAREFYGVERISERHRHRFEFNNKYAERIEAAGLILAGKSPDGRLVEMVELPDHPFFIGCQFHPEFKSRPHDPHPLFTGFVAAARARRDSRESVSASSEAHAVH